jgi:hypothetical protein
MNLNRYHFSTLICTTIVYLVLAAPLLNAAEAKQQATFKKAEDLVAGLLDALQKDDVNAMLDLFDREYEDQILGGDEVASHANMAIIARAMQTDTDLVDTGKNRKILYIGSEHWPFPFPLIRERRRWHFDTEAGIDETINRRVGRNELSAISNCNAYVNAQIQYASADRDGDEVLEYAQVIQSTADNRDGLYWDAAEGEEISPFGPLMADAKAYLSDPGDPYKGYYYKIISRQGANAPGGRYDYIINGNMIAGFGLIAFPADHGNSGVMTFMCNHLGKVYERDLGPDSDLIAAGIDEYNPGSSWKLVE